MIEWVLWVFLWWFAVDLRWIAVVGLHLQWFFIFSFFHFTLPKHWKIFFRLFSKMQSNTGKTIIFPEIIYIYKYFTVENVLRNLITTIAINDLIYLLASLHFLSLALSLSLTHARSRRLGLQACKSRTRADLVLQVEDNGRIKSKTDIREEGDDWRRGTLKRKQMRQRLFYL